MNSMIKVGRFSEFCYEVVKKRNEETEEKTMWEFYLHRVSEQSFEDFRNSVINSSTVNSTSDEEIKTAISDSYDMLNNFVLPDPST